MKTLSLLFFILSFFSVDSLNGQQLSYKPVNPNFGGSYLNYSWLLSSANAQNPFDDQDTDLGINNSPVGGFSDSVKRQILNQLTRDFFSEDGSGSEMEPGSYEVGGLVIDIVETRTGTLITIIDTGTGETTEIIL